MNPDRPQLKLYNPPEQEESPRADALGQAIPSPSDRASLAELSPVGVHLRLYNPEIDGEFGEQTAKFKASLTDVKIRDRMMVSDIELAEGPSVLCKLPECGSSLVTSFIIKREGDGGFSITIPPEKSSAGISGFFGRRSEDVRVIFDREGELVAAYRGNKLAIESESVLAQIDEVIARRVIQYTEAALFEDSVGRHRLA